LETWAERAQADFVGSASGSDPAAVAFDAVSAGVSRGRRVVIVDTAGRLHTQEHLMEELSKVRRVIAQRLPGAPHETCSRSTPPRARTGCSRHASSRRRPR